MKIGTTRLETLSDGVIAIIITIMVLQLKAPDFSKDTSTKHIVDNLRHQLPYFITYAFSFMMVGILWTNHHHMFHLLDKTDEYLLWQNFLFLFFMSLIPYATEIVGLSPFVPVSPAIYGLVMLLTTLSFVLMRQHSLRKKLIHRDKDRELTRQIFKVSFRARTKTIAGTIIYLVSIPLAFVNVYLAYFCFIFPVIIFFIPEGLDNEEFADKVGAKNL